MHSSKTTLSYLATMTVQTCMHSRTMSLLACERLTSHGDVRLAVCLQVNVQQTSLLNNTTGLIFRWHSNKDAQTIRPLSEYLHSNLRSVNTMPTKQHIARQTSFSAPPNIICCSCLEAIMATNFYSCYQLVKVVVNL